MSAIEDHYNKFNEDKRLKSRHGNAEFVITMKYIHQLLARIKEEKKLLSNEDLHIFDIGAGTGAYSIPLSEQGYDVTAIELVKHNLGRLKANGPKVHARQGNALNLKKYAENCFDLVLVFGPMYHLFTMEEKQKVLEEAKRVTKPGGYIMVAYLMNEYGLISYAFKEGHLQECMEQGRITEDFRCLSNEKDLYDYMTLQQIEELDKLANCKRIKIFTPDGPANYIRPSLKNMTEQEYNFFLKYIEYTAERMDLMGAAAHTVDILRKEET